MLHMSLKCLCLQSGFLIKVNSNTIQSKISLDNFIDWVWILKGVWGGGGAKDNRWIEFFLYNYEQTDFVVILHCNIFKKSIYSDSVFPRDHKETLESICVLWFAILVIECAVVEWPSRPCPPDMTITTPFSRWLWHRWNILIQQLLQKIFINSFLKFSFNHPYSTGLVHAELNTSIWQIT